MFPTGWSLRSTFQGEAVAGGGLLVTGIGGDSDGARCGGAGGTGDCAVIGSAGGGDEQRLEDGPQSGRKEEARATKAECRKWCRRPDR